MSRGAERTTPGGNTLTDWNYAVAIEPQGATMYGIEHDGHVFAQRVGLIRSYVRLSNRAGSTFVPFALGTDAGMVGKAMRFDKAPARSPDHYYQLSHRVYQYFQIRDLAGSGQKLEAKQYFAFTEASNSPRHETLGIASAGRFYPSIDFFVPRVANPESEAIDALRFDFWIEPALGAGGRRVASRILPITEVQQRILDVSLAEDVAELAPQQAGLFRDAEDPGLFPSASAQAGSLVFDSAEKPLLWEVAADGIRRGGRSGWDNIHIWAYSPRGLVSTPGMPYGIHLHWRWAASLTNFTAMVLGGWTRNFLPVPELAGRSAQGGMIPGGPLIDPRSPDTDLRIAFVTPETAETYEGMTASEPEEFVELFKRIAEQPDDSESGRKGMVAIISIVLRRPHRGESWRSTVFPHGLFFPHAYDLGYIIESGLSLADAYSPQYLRSRPPRKWQRDPN
jgi:hypothetical protein